MLHSLVHLCRIHLHIVVKPPVPWHTCVFSLLHLYACASHCLRISCLHHLSTVAWSLMYLYQSMCVLVMCVTFFISLLLSVIFFMSAVCFWCTVIATWHSWFPYCRYFTLELSFQSSRNTRCLRWSWATFVFLRVGYSVTFKQFNVIFQHS